MIWAWTLCLKVSLWNKLSPELLWPLSSWELQPERLPGQIWSWVIWVFCKNYLGEMWETKYLYSLYVGQTGLEMYRLVGWLFPNWKVICLSPILWGTFSWLSSDSSLITCKLQDLFVMVALFMFLEFVRSFLTEVCVGGEDWHEVCWDLLSNCPDCLSWSYLVFCLWSDFCLEINLTGHLSSKPRLKAVASSGSLGEMMCFH